MTRFSEKSLFLTTAAREMYEKLEREKRLAENPYYLDKVEFIEDREWSKVRDDVPTSKEGDKAMNIIDLLRALSVPGMKTTIEYNYDYDCHVITFNIGDIEHKNLVHSLHGDASHILNLSRYVASDICRSVSFVKSRYEEACRNERH